MANEKVEILFAANDAEVIRALQRQNRELDKQIQKLQQAADKSKRATTQQKSGIDAVTASAVKLVAGYASVTTVISSVTQANNELIAQAKQVGIAYDEMFKKLQVQAGLSDLQRDRAKLRISYVAEELATPVEQTAAAATQLVSSGFSTEEATGESLRAFLQVLSATNQTGEGVATQELALALSQFLNANQLEKTSENILAVGKNLQALFQGTNVQLPGLTPLAGVTGAIKDQISFQEQLAAQALLVETFQAPQAAIGLRNTISRLSAAGASNERVAALEGLGLTKEDVDFVGENFQTVLDRLGAAFDRLSEEQRPVAATKLFGEEGRQFAQFLIDNRETYRRFFELQQDDTPFQLALRNATQGRNAAAIRQQVREERVLEQKDDGGDLFQKELEIQAREVGVREVDILVQRKLYDLARGFGANPERALEFAVSPYDLGFAVNPNERKIIESIQAGVSASLQPTGNGQFETPVEDLRRFVINARPSEEEITDSLPGFEQRLRNRRQLPENDPILKELREIKKNTASNPQQATAPQSVSPRTVNDGQPQKVQVVNPPSQSGGRRPVAPASRALSKQ